ncbi:transposase IS4 family protein, partial [mine drainage metagenome]
MHTHQRAQEAWSAPDVVRGYKDLGNVEKAFRCLKQVDLKVRPIFLRKTDHVKAHIFLCVLAYYVEWHMRQKLAELLYADEEIQANRGTRDPVLRPSHRPRPK